MKFIPISHSWVAIHPQPIGVVQFIGGALFGTLGSTFFYQNLLEFVYKCGYTIILLPFKFTFNHYQEAGFLIGEQYEILPELVRLSLLNDYDYTAYLDNENFYWLGHSIGCKYITLLEGFSALPDSPQARQLFIQQISSKTQSSSRQQSIVAEIETLIQDLQQQVTRVKQYIKDLVGREIILGERIATLFIKGQISVLIAPDNSDTQSAIQFKPLADLLDRCGWGVFPTPAETNNLIIESDLFNRMGLVYFKSDTTARSTVTDFIDLINKPSIQYRSVQSGGHLRPLGFSFFNLVVNPFDFLYAWVRYIARIDTYKPTNLTDLFQPREIRAADLEQRVTNLYSSLQNLNRLSKKRDDNLIIST
jgi:Protein of unknown function (DUF1350)